LVKGSGYFEEAYRIHVQGAKENQARNPHEADSNYQFFHAGLLLGLL
jgi:hypothetical protein